MLMIEPPRPSAMRVPISAERRKAPLRLTARTLSHSSSLTSASDGYRGDRPALLTRMSTCPKRSRTVSARASHCAHSPTWQPTPSASRPVSRTISSANATQASALRLATTTVAPWRAYATLLTPARDAAGDPDKRWDTRRNAAFNEILGFYGLTYWYAWQVTILGLGPIWQSDNEAARRRAAQLLDDGAVFAFGLSEREHGADIYSTDMVLEPDGDGGFTATGGKYYIGNGNVARMVS